MKNRREFLKELAGYLAIATVLPLAGCGNEEEGSPFGIRGAAGSKVTLYDTHAMALYLDGSLGPKTGVIKVQYIIDNVELTLPFWHGHGGVNHKFTMTPADFQKMKELKKVTLETTEVDSHKHKLFIDFNDARYRVAGAKPVPVTL